jgi:predicted DNA-binding transcriptional regulator AlpA
VRHTPSEVREGLAALSINPEFARASDIAIDDPFLDARTIAQNLLGVGVSTFYRYIADGIFPEGVLISPSCRRWRLSAIVAAIEARRK